MKTKYQGCDCTSCRGKTIHDDRANRIGRWMGYLSLAVMIMIIMLIAMFVIAFLINSIIDVLSSIMNN